MYLKSAGIEINRVLFIPAMLISLLNPVGTIFEES
jgi:hypothetical protein